MAAPPSTSGAPITSKRELIEYLEAGCKTETEWRIGTEHEKFVFQKDTYFPAPYEGSFGIPSRPLNFRVDCS